MPLTPKGIYYPDETTPVSPLHPVFGGLATSVDDALGGVRIDTPAGIHRVDDAAGLATLLTDLDDAGYALSNANPVYAYRQDTQLLYENKGSGWRIYQGTPRFADTTARDAAIPSPQAGDEAIIGTGAAMQITAHDGSTWRTIWSDTGWQAVTLVAGYTASVPVQVRRVGDEVQWRGRLAGAGLGTAGTKQLALAASIPAWALPSSYQYTPCRVATIPTDQIAQATVSSTNGLEVSVGTVGLTDVWLAGLRYTH